METLAAQIASAVNLRSLYPAKHPRVVQSVERMIAAVNETTEASQSDAATYILVGDDLLFGEQVLRNRNLAIDAFVALLKRRGVERITLARGLEPEEAARFVAALASGEALQPSKHIILGRANVSLVDEAAREERRKLSVDQIETIRDSWARFRIERRMPIDQMEQLVWSLIDSISGTTRSMLPIAPLKDHDEYTFVHSINVAILVLLQARSFGIWGPMLHMFGMAALCHDIGKLSVPRDILNKPGRLDDREWEIMKRHTQAGALYLSGLEGTSPLSAVVAYEHHLRFDGHAGYPRLRKRRQPNLASRMTAIADAYDAMCTLRPYDQTVGKAAALETIRGRSGSYYDPTLVSNFVRLIGSAATA